IREPRGDRVEEAPDHDGVVHHRQHLAARVEALALGERDHLVGGGADRLRLRFRREHALVAEERCEQVAEHRQAVVAPPPELVVALAVPHLVVAPRPSAPSRFGSMRMPSDSPRPASAALISSIVFSPRFFTSTRSVSVFCARSATSVMSAAFSALTARAGRSSSSSALPSASRRYAPSASSLSS